MTDNSDDRRRDTRGRPHKPHVVYLRLVNGTPIKGEIEDLSYRGAKVRFPTQVSLAQVGEAARLLLGYTPANRSLGIHGIPLHGEVVRTSKTEEGTVIALRLRDVRDMHRAEMVRFIDDITEPPPAA